MAERSDEEVLQGYSKALTRSNPEEICQSLEEIMRRQILPEAEEVFLRASHHEEVAPLDPDKVVPYFPMFGYIDYSSSPSRHGATKSKAFPSRSF